jgi:hypothetical protein
MDLKNKEALGNKKRFRRIEDIPANLLKEREQAFLELKRLNSRGVN